jgi:hypothetical protein
MRTCSKPCNAEIDRTTYLEDVDDAIRFISGREGTTIRLLVSEMERLASEERFEDAARLKKRMERIERARKDHRDVYTDLDEFDAVVVMASGSTRRRKVAHIRRSKIVGFEEHDVSEIQTTLDDSINSVNSVNSVSAIAAMDGAVSAHAPESGTSHYDDFCLVSSFLAKPVRTVQILPMGPDPDTAALVGDVVHQIEAEREQRSRKTSAPQETSEPN